MTERVYVALDLETTGLNPNQDRIIEIGAVRIENGDISARFSTLVNPQRKIPLRVRQITGISNDDVADAPLFDDVLPELLSFVRADVSALVAHNAGFDLGFLASAGVNFHRPALDTFDLAGMLLPGMASYSLGELCRAMHVELTDAHRALDDAHATGELFLLLRSMIHGLPQTVLETLRRAGDDSNWPPLLLIQEALEGFGTHAVADPRTDTRTARSTTPHLSEAEVTLVKDGGPPPTSVDPAVLDAIFAEGGTLSDLYGADYELRHGQVEMAHLVLDALNEGKHRLMEAGTGVGKSLAYLLPAALWSMQNQRRVVIATNTIALQDQLLDKDIPQIRALLQTVDGGELGAALLKGRQNYLCTRRLHEWYRGRTLTALELTVLAKVLIWLPATEMGDVSELFMPSSAERAIWRRISSDSATCNPGVCSTRSGERDFYWDARRRAEHAHIVVVNHALLTADLAGEHRTLPPYSHLVVDEAHHLEDVITEQMTYRVDWQDADDRLARLTLKGDCLAQVMTLGLQSRARRIQEQGAAIAGSAQRVRRALERFVGQLRNFAVNHTNVRTDVNYSQRLALDGRMRAQPMWSQLEIEWDQTGRHLESLCAALGDLVNHLVSLNWQRQPPEALALAELSGLGAYLQELSATLNGIILQPHGARDSVAWLEYNKEDNRADRVEVSLAAAPLYIGDIVHQSLLKEMRSIVLTGATLRTGADFRFIRERLGLWDVDAAVVESPFDYRRSTLLYLPADMPLPNDSQYQHAVEEAILQASTAAGGRTLVLFTSYAHLRATAEGIRAPLDRLGITVLQHGASSRRRLLREYRQTERAVLLGTRSFWEGIDLPGEQLSVLIMVKLPFAVPSDPLVAARSAELENSFSEYTLPDAILRFRQGFGRLIRRASDRGVVVMLDSRLWQKQYGSAFLEALPECTVRRAKLDNLGVEVDLWLNGARDTR